MPPKRKPFVAEGIFDNVSRATKMRWIRRASAPHRPNEDCTVFPQTEGTQDYESPMTSTHPEPNSRGDQHCEAESGFSAQLDDEDTFEQEFASPIENLAHNDEEATFFVQQEDVNGFQEKDSPEGIDLHDFSDDKKLLYDKAPLTVAESICAILLFALRHSLSGQCISDLLSLIALHCITPNLCKTSLYFFRKFFSNVSSPFTCHYYCNVCHAPLPEKKECASCFEILGKSPGFSYFIQVSILSQLQNMFLRDSFCNDLKYRFNRKKANNDNIEDIYDGQIYKSLASSGYSDLWHNITFMWNSDGVSIFNSSKFSLWPFYLVINELNYKKRMSKENLIISGLWFGSAKPSVNVFLQPLYISLTELEKGYPMKTQGCDSLLVRARLICGTCDLPAKCHFLNITQFNGFYGCCYCKHPGRTIHTGTNSHVFAYPGDQHCPLRTDSETMAEGKEAVISGKPVFGVKGVSLLHYMSQDFITGIGIDAMHGAFLGVCRKLMYLWIDPKFKSLPFSLLTMLPRIESRFLSIKPPSFVQRVPRSIKETLKFWKAHEFKYFLMLYSVPVFYGIMDKIYLEHHILLVSALFILLKRSISLTDVHTAESLLFKYVSDFERLYGARFMSINIHQLVHLPTSVLRLGPLWVASCFSFEDFNGGLVKLVHGTQYPDKQIGYSFPLFIYSSLLRQELKPGSPVHNFCSMLDSRRFSVKTSEIISPNIVSIGKIQYLANIPLLIKKCLFSYNSNKPLGRCWQFGRIKWKGSLLTSRVYTNGKSLRHNTCSVSFMFNAVVAYGEIHCFLKQVICTCNDGACTCQVAYFAIINKYSVQSNAVTNFIAKVENIPKFLKVVTLSKMYLAIPVTNLMEQLLYVSIESEFKYIAHYPNDLENVE